MATTKMKKQLEKEFLTGPARNCIIKDVKKKGKPFKLKNGRPVQVYTFRISCKDTPKTHKR